MSDLDLEPLETLPLAIEGRLVDASNATLFGSIALSPNESLSIVYKPVAGERPLWDFPHGTLASREVAAYRISELSGIGCVPPTVLRDGPYGLGAVQRWIDVDENIDVIELGQSQDPRIRSMALFDVVVNNTDRKFGHILPASDGRVFGCDHGVTFHVDYKLRTVLWQFAGLDLSDEEKELLISLLTKIDRDTDLNSLLDAEEIAALKTRIEELLNDGAFPFPSQEWPAVPWPPV